MDQATLLQQIEQLLSQVAGYVWGWPLLILLFGTHLYLTIRLKFIQRYIGKAIKLSFSRSTQADGAGDVSHFGALMTALAATIGTGNIVGVATAIATGGPGAVLWMWLTGVFGISTKFAEAVLSVKYRTTNPLGQMAGGPMYVLERGLNAKWLGVLFAFFTAIAAFGIGNMVQANSVTDGILGIAPASWQETVVNVPYIGQFMLLRIILGAVIAFLVGIVIIGGIKSIARTCEILVPFMAVFYIIGCLILLILSIDTIPQTIKLIFTSAFSGHKAIVGGFLGAGMKEAVRMGIARGLFSNESGLGSAPIVAAAAKTSNPVRQALVSSTGTFWDTVVVCALTGLVIVNSGDWQNGATGVTLTKAAFDNIPYVGSITLIIGLMTFVFSTILGWSYYGEKAVEYLFGTPAIKPYRWLWVAAVFIGSVSTLKIVWDFADIANALMALPNLISLIILAPVIVAETRKYLWENKMEKID